MKAKSDKKRKNSWHINASENFFSVFGIPIALVVVCLVWTMTTSAFLTVENIMNILRQVSITAIAALGTTFILISGGIDISMGAVMAASSVTTVGLMVDLKVNMIVAILAGLAVGCIVGFINGIIYTKFKIPIFIVTLGTAQIVRGISFIYTQGYSKYGDNIPEAFGIFGRGYIGVIPVPVIIMLLLYVIFYIIAKRTVFGTYIYAIGSNEKASRLSGINVDAARIVLYVIGGLASSISGIILASRMNSAQAGSSNGVEFDILTAVVLGGTSIYGGKGKVLRTLLGAVMIGVLNNGMTLLNVSSFWRMVVSGFILILALALDRINAKD